MIVKPITTYRPRPIALVFPGWRTLRIDTIDGSTAYYGPGECRAALVALSGHACFVTGGLTQIRHSTGAGQWEASTWRGRAVKMSLLGSKTTVSSLRGIFDGSTAPFDDLTRVVEWLATLRVSPATLSSMAWGLWRAGLSKPVSVHADGAVSKRAMFGGRQWAAAETDSYGAPKVYTGMVSLDMSCAYPSEMADRPYALSLRKVSPTTTIDPMRAGLARVAIDVPNDAPFGPLPIRIDTDAIQFPHGRIVGIWSWCEIAAAQSLGFAVEVRDVWAPSIEGDLFGQWRADLEVGRQLPGQSAALVKMIGNSLWGLFGMTATDKAVVTWTDDIGDTTITLPLPVRNLPHAATVHVAAETASRVRTRLMTDVLYGGGAAPVHVDTDGVIVRKSAPLPKRSGHRAGEWRVKETMRKVDVRAPQVYRWQCGKGCGVTHAKWHHVVAGTPPAQAAGLFERSQLAGIRHGIIGTDLVVEGGHTADKIQRNNGKTTARAANAMLFGPPLGGR